MKLYVAILISLLSFSACDSCSKSSTKMQAAQSIDGKTLIGTITYGSGVFSGLEGYSFTTSFTKNGQFVTTNRDKVVESKGSFSYTAVNTSVGVLTLIDSGGMHLGQKIEVTLNFTSNSGGTFNAKLLSGQPGEENGTFELK